MSEDPKQMTAGSAEALPEMLSTRVEIGGIAGETDSEKINAVDSSYESVHCTFDILLSSK